MEKTEFYQLAKNRNKYRVAKQLDGELAYAEIGNTYFSDTLLHSVGDQIKAIRKLQGLSQLEVAALINTDRVVITNIENGNSNVTLKTLARIACYLDVKISIKIDFLIIAFLFNLQQKYIW